MKFGPKLWYEVQEMLDNLRCPHCSNNKIQLTEEHRENALCTDCGCKFEFNPDLIMSDYIM